MDVFVRRFITSTCRSVTRGVTATSTSTGTVTRAPALHGCASASSCRDSPRIADVGLAPSSPNKARLAGPTPRCLMWISRTPAATNGSASLTFWRQGCRAPSATGARPLQARLCSYGVEPQRRHGARPQSCITDCAQERWKSSAGLGVSTSRRAYRRGRPAAVLNHGRHSERG